MLRKVLLGSVVRNNGLHPVKKNEVYMNCKKGSVVEYTKDEKIDKKVQCLET